MRWGRSVTVAAATAGMSLGVALACGGAELRLSDIEERPDGSTMLYVQCAEDVSARVTESADAVHVDDISGNVVDGDCLGAVSLDLEAPIEERRLVVNGERWVRIDADCELAVYAPERVADERMWAVPRRCPSN